MKKSFYHEYFNIISPNRGAYLGCVYATERLAEIPIEEAQANQRLIQHAPEMLAMLETLYAEMENPDNDYIESSKVLSLINRVKGK